MPVGERMLGYYVKIAFRNLLKHKGYSSLCIAGLAIGMACVLVIVSWVQDELSYDGFHAHADQIERVTGRNWAQTPAPLGPALQQFLPDVVSMARLKKADRVFVSCGGRGFYEEDVVFADPAFLAMFTFPLLSGDRSTALNDPSSMVITQEVARKYFGDDNPMGKTLTYDGKRDFRVTGVLQEMPRNTHMRFDILCSLQSAKALFGEDFFENKMNTVVFTYVQIRDGAEPARVAGQMDAFTRSYLGAELYAINTQTNEEWRQEFLLQPIRSIHLHSHLGGEFQPNGDATEVWIFSIVALLILLIACANYMNLSIARSMNRLKEVAVRKVVGAGETQIVVQMMCESLLVSGTAIILGMVLSRFLDPFLSPAFTGKGMRETVGAAYAIVPIGIALCAGVLSGIYPALFIARVRPVRLFSTSILWSRSPVNAARALVPFQFVVSTTLIIAVLVISRQLSFLQNTNLGFEKDRVVVVPLHDETIRRQCQSFKRELLRQQGIVAVTASSAIPGDVRWVTSFRWDGQGPRDDNTLRYIGVDQDFIGAFGIPLLAGRDFSVTFPSDTVQSYIVNESALAKLGWQSGVGKRLELFWRPQGSVIGVVRNFHFTSLRQKIEPLAFYIDPHANQFLSIRLRDGDISGGLRTIERTYSLFSPNRPFEYFFLDDYWHKLYGNEEDLKSLFLEFTGLAVFLACLGLFGLAAYSAERRAKEVGIRKVLGASVVNLMVMLSGDVAKWVLAANVIAWPIAYFAMERWLQNFAYRVDLGWWTFFLAGGLTLCVALLTVSAQAMRAARANPVESLRYE